MKTTIRYIAAIFIALIAMPEYTLGQTPDTDPPSIPTGLTVIETHNDAIGINWTASTDNVGLAGYRIFVDDLEYGTSVDNEYIILDLDLNTVYTIEVSAFDAASNESVRSPDINHTTSTSSITGTVLWMGDPYTGATVNLEGLDVNLGSVVNSSGAYSFMNLNAGLYGLTIGTETYYLEAYEGHNTIHDIFLGDDLPVVHTGGVGNIISTYALGGGTATGSGITDKGAVWSTTPNITALSEDTISFGAGAGTFVGEIFGLAPNTVYYIRTFAINSQGIGWGEEYRFYTGCIPIILNELLTNNNCGGTNGAISISHINISHFGFVAPFTYTWTGPEGFTSTSKDINSLETGIYEVTVFDRNGCLTIESYVISEPPSPAINNLTATTCSGSGFTVLPENAVDGIVPPGTTYSWGLPVVTGGMTFGTVGVEEPYITGTLSNPTNSPQTATYTVTPTTGTCTGATFTITVTVNPTPAINSLSTTTCSGSGFIVSPVNAVDGIVPPGTTYSWGVPVVTGGLTGGSASGLKPITISGVLSNPTNTPQTATYTVIPTTGTCTGASFTLTVTVDPAPEIIVNNLTHVSCDICNDGAIDITVSGGVPNYNYSWTGPDGYTSTSEDITDLSPGIYMILASDNSGCSASLEVEVGHPLVVTKVSDYDPYEDDPVLGTLRYAMEYANSNEGLDSILFNIVGDGPFTIFPTSNLPGISESVVIDGYSQAGTIPADANNRATIHIEINGSQYSDEGHYGFFLENGSSVLRGLMINGYNDYAIRISQNSIENVIEGNHLGIDMVGDQLSANRRGCIQILNSSNNIIGGDTPAQRNVMAGTGSSSEEFYSLISIQGLSAQGNVIKGNYLGVNAGGQTVLGTTDMGISVLWGHHNTIGPNNVISGLSQSGIYLSREQAHHNTILGNFIGTNYNGTSAIPNVEKGILISGACDNLVGGADPGARNIISGNGLHGILIETAPEGDIATGNIIQGNYIGLNSSGLLALGNGNHGITILCPDNIVGGDNPGEGNVISGNDDYGLSIGRANGIQIMGNFIGTNFNGSASIPNVTGIYIEGSENNVIGGPDPGNGNLISGNGEGIVLNADGDRVTENTVIQGNFIGSDLSGENPIGNGIGIRIGDYASYNLIGGIGHNHGNLIAYNSSGIVSDGTFHPSTENRFLSNSIHSNTVIGIDLSGDMVTPNDTDDSDGGPNMQQNFPHLDTVYFSQNEITVFGFLQSNDNNDFLLQFFVSPQASETGYGEGKTYIGSDTVTTNGTGYAHINVSFTTSLRDGLVVTATATDDMGNTSEFSNAVGGAQDQVAAVMPMHFVINEQGLPYVTDNSDFLALQYSLDTWSEIPTSTVDFVNDGPTSQVKAVANDGINLITFMDEEFFTTNEVLGLAAKTLFMDDASGTATIVDADIVFNPYFTQGDERFGTETYNGVYDLQSIATHEIGHTFGMIHSGVLESTMFYAIIGNTTDKQSLEQDDISWASYRYQRQPEYDQTFGSISGNIRYGDDPAFPVVGGALVVATNTTEGFSIHSYSDENGDYLIPALPAGNYTVAIEPLDGNVHGYFLTKANISYYIDGITVYTDFPNEYYNGESEGAENDDPENYETLVVNAGTATTDIDLITNKDVTPPEVQAVTPKRDSVGVGVMTQIFMGFSEPVSITTFADSTCYLTSENGEVYGNFVIADNYGRRIAFTPREYPLDYSLLYTLHITDDITDLKGNGLNVAEYTSQFTTENPDIIAPWVTDIIPDHGNDTVFTNAYVMVFFSEPMDVSTTPNGFSLEDGNGVLVPGDYLWNENLDMLTFNPGSFLAEGTSYTVEVNAGLQDLSQNPLETDTVLVFTTVPQAPPKITLLGPAPDQDSVSLDSPLVLDFSEPIDPLTINSSNIQLLLGSQALSGQFEFIYDNSRVIFRPDQLLAPNITYNVVISDQISDVSDPKLSLEQGMAYTFETAPTVKVPFIDYLKPSSGVAGTMVTIGGWGIDPNPDNVTIMFGDQEASILYNETSFITTLVPIGASAGMVSIEVNGTVSNEEYFYVVPTYENPEDEIRRVVGTQSQAEDVVIEPDAAYAYITNSGANSITRLNMVTFEVQSLAVGQMPVQIDIHPNGDMAYVTNFLSHTVSVVNLDLMEVVETIPVGINPYGIVSSPNGDLLFVANSTSQDVLYIDVDQFSGGYDRVVRSVKTNASNKDIDISPDAGLVLIACEQGILFLISDQDDPAFNTIIRTVKTSASASSVQITPDGGLAVAATDDNYLVIIGITPGNNYGNIVGKVNTRSSVGDIAISPDGLLIYATHPATNEVSVYQISYTGEPNADASVNLSINLELVNVIEVDEMPYSIAIDPKAETVLVGHYTDDGQVTEIDVSGTVDIIRSLEDLIASVENAIENDVVSDRYGRRLLRSLKGCLYSYNSGWLYSARFRLDIFIWRVKIYMKYDKVPEDLGNAWLDAAYRIRAQLVEEIYKKSLPVEGSRETGSGIRSMDDSQVAISNQRDLPGEKVLKLENRPNPFSYHTQVHFEIPNNGETDIPVIVRVYNTSGQVVKTLVHMGMEPGRYSVMWNSDLDDGGMVADGIYLLELRIPGERKAIRISVAK